MNPVKFPGRCGQRRVPRSWCVYPVPAALFGILFVAAGITGGTCADALPVPNGNDGDGGNTYGSGARPRPIILGTDHILGDPDAPLIVVEYEEYQSQSCGRFARSEFPVIKEQYIDTGKVCWVFRHFPLADDDRAGPAARAAECAHDQGAFFEYRDLIYETTDVDGNTILTDETFRQHATTLALDGTQFDACVEGQGKSTRVQQDVKSGAALRVTAVPTFFVGDEMVTGLETAEKLGGIIDRHLNESQ